MIGSIVDEKEHHDHYSAVYFNFFFQGICSLIPWNVLIFAYDYFKMRLATVPQASSFLLHFVLIFMTMKFLFLISGINFTKHISADKLISWSAALLGIVLGSICLISIVEFITPQMYYYLILTLVLLAAFFSAFIEAGFLAILAFFPSRYTQSYLVGISFAGVVTAIIHMATLWGTSTLSKSFAEYYFSIASVLLLASLFLFRYMLDLEMFQFYFQRGRSVIEAKKEAERLERDTGMKTGVGQSMLEVFKEISDLIITIFIINWLNLLVSPYLVLKTQSEHYQATNLEQQSFFHVIALFLGGIFDLVGKCLPGISSLAIKKMPFIFLATTRLIFLPLLLFGNLHVDNQLCLPFKPLYSNDWIFYAILCLKAFTGGYLGTLCMMWAPMRVKDIDRSTACTLMVYSMGLGILIGSFSSYALESILFSLSK